MRRDEEGEDSLWLFGDVMCGTMGIVMIIALFFSIRGATDSTANSSRGIAPELAEELILKQREAAFAERTRTEQRLDKVLASLPGPRAGTAEDANQVLAWYARDLPADPLAQVAAAQMRNYVRLAASVTEAELRSTAARQLLDLYGERIDASRADFVQRSGVQLRIPRERASAQALAPFYVLVRGGRLHPLFRVVADQVVRDNTHNAWILFDEGKRIRCIPAEDGSWSEAEADHLLRALAAKLASLPGWQLVLLVQPDSFQPAREFIRLLDGQQARFSWQPHLQNGFVSMSAAGVPPAGPRE